jgi:hypothetical protein
MKRAMNENEIEAPQLLAGININEEDDEIKKLNKKKSGQSSKAATQSIMVDKFEEQRSKDRQSLYREREV